MRLRKASWRRWQCEPGPIGLEIPVNRGVGSGVERKDVPGGEMARAEMGRDGVGVGVNCIWPFTWSHKLGWKQDSSLWQEERSRSWRSSLNAKARSPQLNLVGTGHHC